MTRRRHPDLIRAVLLAVAVLLVAFLAFAAGVAYGHYDPSSGVYCPTEDSCRPEYGEDGWVIVEMTP